MVVENLRTDGGDRITRGQQPSEHLLTITTLLNVSVRNVALQQ